MRYSASPAARIEDTCQNESLPLGSSRLEVRGFLLSISRSMIRFSVIAVVRAPIEASRTNRSSSFDGFSLEARKTPL